MKRALPCKLKKVKRKAILRNRYNQVPHLTQDTIWESDKTQKTQHTREQRGQPFPVGYHNAARNRQASITKTNMKQNNKKDTQKRHRFGMVSKKNMEGLNMLNGTNLTFSSDVDQDT